eukprot:maker-scaffold_7-snap-gene-19.75-mRNA-1 protein AED:0.09 eAED:0.09 QI:238/0.8/0.66/1/0.4/0.16/6/0/320
MKPGVLSSMEVFKIFIEKSQAKDLVGEKVISQECFELWIKTRRRKVKFPFDSFKRTVFAHLRGGPGRKPFEEEIESALLQYIRTSAADGTDPFSRCCPSLERENKCKRSYKSWKTRYKDLEGYHEAQRNSRHQQIVKKEVLPLSTTVLFQKSQYSPLWDMSDLDFTQKLEISRKFLKFSDTAVQYMLNNLGNDCFFYSKEFVVPFPENCYFRDDYPVMRQVVNPKTWAYQDDSCIQTLGKYDHVSQLQLSVIEYFNKMRYMLPLLKKNKSVWFRSVVDINGEKRVLLYYTKIINENVQESFLQLDPRFNPSQEGYHQMLF